MPIITAAGVVELTPEERAVQNRLGYLRAVPSAVFVIEVMREGLRHQPVEPYAEGGGPRHVRGRLRSDALGRTLYDTTTYAEWGGIPPPFILPKSVLWMNFRCPSGCALRMPGHAERGVYRFDATCLRVALSENYALLCGEDDEPFLLVRHAMSRAQQYHVYHTEVCQQVVQLRRSDEYVLAECRLFMEHRRGAFFENDEFVPAHTSPAVTAAVHALMSSARGVVITRAPEPELDTLPAEELPVEPPPRRQRRPRRRKEAPASNPEERPQRRIRLDD